MLAFTCVVLAIFALTRAALVMRALGDAALEPAHLSDDLRGGPRLRPGCRALCVAPVRVARRARALTSLVHACSANRGPLRRGRGALRVLLRGGGGVGLLGRVLRALQLHRRRLPRVHARGPREHLGVVSGAAGRRARRGSRARDLGDLRAALDRCRRTGARAAFRRAGRQHCSRVSLHSLASRSPPSGPRASTANRFANELAANGLYNLFSAFRHNELEYAPFYVTEDPADASRELRALLADPSGDLRGRRPHRSHARGRRDAARTPSRTWC